MDLFQILEVSNVVYNNSLSKVTVDICSVAEKYKFKTIRIVWNSSAKHRFEKFVFSHLQVKDNTRTVEKDTRLFKLKMPFQASDQLWCAQQESNLQPSESESNALSIEL